MIVCRIGRRRPASVGAQNRFNSLSRALYHVLFKVTQAVTGIGLPCEVELARNFIIDHFGGIIISGYAKFGDNCRIRDGVVVGLCHV